MTEKELERSALTLTKNWNSNAGGAGTLSLCSFAHFQAALRVASTVAHSLTSFSGSDLMIVNSRNLVSAYICSGVNFPLSCESA
jgi:hypothetical protein